MAERKVILTARADGRDAPEFLLVEETRVLRILRNGEPLPDARWPAAELERAVDAFNTILTDNGIC